MLSRTFSINQADVIFERDPDLDAHRRYGLRIDLQFGQATETLQGNPSVEPRPEIYRNLFQAYGTYVIPLGKGLNFDFGKWASSLGMEGNYTKDQINYSRSYYFYFLPFYHAGVRLHYNLTDKFGVNYWVVNGTNQSEPNNGYRDELFGFVTQPKKTLSWTFNYYLGQEHPDTVPATNCTVPVQPGLCLAPLIPAPNGKLHIFDSYANWNATPKLTLALEGDYVIQREWANAGPGHSSAPAHTDGGAAYVQYSFSPRQYVAARTEYMSDRGGMFSNVTQALKEVTGTYRYNFGDGFSTFLSTAATGATSAISPPATQPRHPLTRTQPLSASSGGTAKKKAPGSEAHTEPVAGTTSLTPTMKNRRSAEALAFSGQLSPRPGEKALSWIDRSRFWSQSVHETLVFPHLRFRLTQRYLTNGASEVQPRHASQISRTKVP